jgi:SAM-dependent methyltransferase
MKHSEPVAPMQEQTVVDFGEQWGRYTDNSGYYGSLELFRDIFGPLLAPQDVAGRRVADIGSGTGRIVQMLMAAGAGHVTAIEPSEAFEVLVANTSQYTERVRCLRLRGDEIPPDGFDLVVSVGVLHHIPEPRPVVEAAWRSLRPGGRIAIWLYGHEGNETYLALVGPLRAITTRLPHVMLAAVSHLLTSLVGAYAAVCRWFPLPLHGYMREVVSRLDRSKTYLTIYDQLNPAYARYYRRPEAVSLLSSAGFSDVRVYHRHGYSWAVTGTRPEDQGSR